MDCKNSMLIDLLFILFYSLVSLFFMRKVAKRLQLLDHPNNRKCHEQATPIAGGLALCIILSNVLYSRPELTPHNNLLLLSIIVLTIIGTLDDKFELNVFVRLSTQILLAVSFIYYSDFQIHHLGNLFGFGEVKLHWLSGAITIAAILGAMNAFNMIDGLNGLLGLLSVITFSSLAVLFTFSGELKLAYFAIIIVVATIPYICMNLGFLGRKRTVFMGDAGSMMIGFIAVWLLLCASQSAQDTNLHTISPVTVLWLIALPLMDMTATISRRLKKGKSPFHCDQEHIHFILKNLGYSDNKTLMTITALAVLFALIGIVSEVVHMPDAIMFYGFLFCFSVYFYTLIKLQRCASKRKDTESSIDETP